MIDLSNRHPATQHFANKFDYEHLPSDLRPVSQQVHDLACKMIATLPDGPELTTGLRKLREAKDCFVLAALDART